MGLIESHGLQEERDALKNRLIEDYSTPSSHQSVVRGSSKRLGLDGLLKRLSALQMREERDLDVKLAYLIAMVSKEQGDSTDMNAKGLDLFQTITVAAQCPTERVRTIQWAADEELQE